MSRVNMAETTFLTSAESREYLEQMTSSAHTEAVIGICWG